MSQGQKGNSGAVSGLDNLSYLNQNEAAQVLRVVAERDPTTNDRRYKIGTIWINKSSNVAWIFTSVTAGSATWALSSPGASDVDTITGDAGGAISPAAGNITLAGGTNMATSGAGSTITFNLDAAVTLATSITSPLYTVGAAADLLITGVAGQDVIVKMGDAAGANKVSFTDSADVEVFAVDSNGGITYAAGGLVIAGAFTQTAGIVSISEDNSANAVGIANGTTARAIDIGSSAAAHVIAVGSVTGAASLDLKAGSGNFTLDGAGATTYTIGASTTGGTIDIGGTAQTGTMTLGDSSGVNIVQIGSGEGATTVNIARGATAAKVVNIADGAVANLVTIGTVSGAASLDLKAGGGNFTLDGDPATTYTIGASTTGGTIDIGGTAQTGTMTLGDSSGVNIVQIGSGEGATTVNIARGATAAKVVNIADGAVANLVTIGTVSGAASLDLKAGTGNFTLEGAIGTTYDISATGANTGTCRFGSGTGARIVEVAGGGTGIKTVNIAAAATADVVTIGDATGAGSLALACGTGNFTLEGATATTYDISGTGVNTGTITVGGGTGAQALNMMNATGVKTVQIATGAAANIVTLGSTNGAAATTIQAGTGGLTLTGTIEAIDAKFVVPTGIDITFSQSPIAQSNLDTGVDPTGANGDLNLLTLQEGVMMEQFIIGTQTIIVPRMTATGLLTSLDLTSTDGAEYNFGAVRNNSKHAFTIGTSPAFFFELAVNLTDVSGCEPFLMGFRKVQANDAAFANYTDFAGYGTNDGISPGDATIQTQLNTGGLVSTDTNDAWADAATHTLKVLVSAAGVVTFTFDGGAPTATQAYTFDNTDVVVPFIHHLYNAVAPGAINLVSMKIGFQ